MAADCVLFDWRAVTWPYQDDALGFVDVLVQRAKTKAVHAVMVAGDWIYREGRFIHVDRNMVLSEIAERLSQPRSAAEMERITLAADVMPHVRRFYDGYLDGGDR